MTSHPSVLGILAEGSVVEIRDPEDGSRRARSRSCGPPCSSGFLSVHDDRVSILAREAELGSQVDRATVQSELDAALSRGRGRRARRNRLR